MHQLGYKQGTILHFDKRYISRWGGIPALLHQELWIKADDGEEIHVEIDRIPYPCRRGHSVSVLLHKGDPVGIINYTTASLINLVSVKGVYVEDSSISLYTRGFLISMIAGIVLLAIGNDLIIPSMRLPFFLITGAAAATLYFYIAQQKAVPIRQRLDLLSRVDEMIHKLVNTESSNAWRN